MIHFSFQVHAFKEKRVALGLTQTQVGLDFESCGLSTLNNYRNSGGRKGSNSSASNAASFSQTRICRIEKLEITPRQAKMLKPVLEVRLKCMNDGLMGDINHLCKLLHFAVPTRKYRYTGKFCALHK